MSNENEKARARRYREAHKDELKMYHHEYYTRIKDTKRREYIKQTRQRRSEYQMKKLYGITANEKTILLKEQNGVCAICERDGSAKELDIDHIHGTKKIRGLLCRNCNQGLGKFLDSPELLARAIEYLNR